MAPKWLPEGSRGPAESRSSFLMPLGALLGWSWDLQGRSRALLGRSWGSFWLFRAFWEVFWEAGPGGASGRAARTSKGRFRNDFPVSKTTRPVSKTMLLVSHVI